jgi:tetratricopeptide (TPR) repeat protein
MEPPPPASPRSLYCPYCGEKVVQGDNFCHSCRRTFIDALIDPSKVSQTKYPDVQVVNPQVAGFLSFIGLGLGQFYNGETAKGLIITLLFFLFPYLLRIYTSINPLIILPVIWAAAIIDAYISSKKINQHIKPFRGKSTFFLIEIVILVSLLIAIIITIISPGVTAHTISMVADAVADTKYPAWSLPVYDTALLFQPNDVGILLKRLTVLGDIGRVDEAKAVLKHIMIMAPNDTAPLVKMGDIMFNEKQYQESINYYDSALSLDQNDAQIWIRRGDVYLAISISGMEKIRGSYINYTSPGQKTAASYDAFKSTEAYREAVMSYNKALKLDPFTSVEVSARVMAATQNLLNTSPWVLNDIGINTTEKTPTPQITRVITQIPPAPNTSIHVYNIAATAWQQKNTVGITYQGGQDRNYVRALEVAFTPYSGTTQHASLPNQIGAEVRFDGGTPQQDHVIVTALLNDGSTIPILDTYV